MSAVTEILRSTFGFDQFRPGQKSIIDALMAGRHVLAVMPTGSGKSLCYQVPALALGGLCIVVSPLVALMQDQVAALKLAGVAAETINSAAPREVNVAIWQKVARGEVRLLYMAPERLMTARMIAALQKLDLRLIAVDEAHCISQWGASFRPEYEALHGLREAFPGVPIGAFTATADEPARRDIIGKLFGGEAEEVVLGFDRPNIRLNVSAKDNPRRQLLAFLDDHAGTSGIVYALSRKSTEELASFLKSKGFRAVPYHAGLSPEVRAETQDLFMTEPAVIVCATIAFGMGIDKPDVRFVFHADLPSSLDAYYQEIGRAGRDGAPAVVQMVFGLDDIRMRRSFIEESDAGDEHKRREHRRLDALIAYCETPACRRMSLLRYFGESIGPCGNCDICISPRESVDRTQEARLVLEAITATGERFGAGHVIDIVTGKSNDRAEALRHVSLPVFGRGSTLARTTWQALVRQMIGAGLIVQDVAGFGGISLSHEGHRLLAGSGEFRFHPDASPAPKGRRSAPKPGTVPLDAPQIDLLGRLKTLRRTLASDRGVPAFVIFSDRTLLDMASKIPRNASDFAEVHGVGAAKLEQFGAVFLTEIQDYLAGA